MSRILLVEDEVTLAAGIQENLELEGYQVEHVAHGQRALQRILSQPYDLVVLDVMLPGLDGFAICQQARQAGCDVPVLFLSARGQVDDRLRGLRAGGDDYLPKPFRLEELLLRVGAILRRRGWTGAAPQREVRFGDNRFDVRAMTATSWDGREHVLTHKEAQILETLAARDNQVVSRDDLLDAVWGNEVFPSSRTIDNFLLRLRKRFEPVPEQPRYFHTVRGIGYRFTSGEPQ